MSTLHLPPHPQPSPSPADPIDAGTVRNWVGNQALPPEMNLEPAAILENLREADPVAASRLQKALNQFPPIGATLAGFHLVAILGRGTFGRVYLARQGDLADRFVALKVSTDLVGESQTLARLQHTNIVPIYSVHRATPFQAVCMPFFGVTTLAHLLRRFRGSTTLPATGRQLLDTLKVINDETAIPSIGPRTSLGIGTQAPLSGSVTSSDLDERVPVSSGPARPAGPLDQLRRATYPDAVCWIGSRLASGLEHAHSHGILHNDLKPANVLLTDEGEPMLLDFGVSEDLMVRVAAPGSPVGGTLPYMAPEHLRSVRDRVPATDARSDVYALGIILFELLTGRHPFRVPDGKLDEELPRMLEERTAPPPRLRSLNKAVTPGLEAIVRKCLEPDPARRYQSAADLRDDLDRHRVDLPLRHVRVPSIRERVRKWARRNPRLTSNLSLGTAAAITILFCTVAFSIRQTQLKQAQLDAAARLEQERIDTANRLALAHAEAEQQQHRYQAEVASRQFGSDLTQARYLLSSRVPETVTIEAGIARCEAALARYGLPADAHWEQRPEFRALPPEEQQRVRFRLAETCLLLANGYSLRAKPGPDGEAALTEAIRVNKLAERLAGHNAPRALWDQRAALFRRLDRVDDATHATDRAKQTPLLTGRDYYLSGMEAFAAGQQQEALQLFRRSAELDPGSFWTHMALGLAHESLGQFADASACYTTAIALWPDYHGGYEARSRVRMRQRDYARAKADLDQAAELNAESFEVYLSRALAHQALREYAAGLRDLERALACGAPRTRVLLMRSRLRELNGDTEGAKKDLAEGLREEPTDDLGWVARGLARLSTDLPGAIADFDAALALNPRCLSAMQNKAHALSKLDRHRDAIQVFDQLLERYPDYVPARAGRAVMYARLGDEQAAIADAEEALRRDQGAPNVYQLAGVYALLDGKRPGARAEAIRLLTAALRAGFGHEYIETDRDLDPIRDTPEFKRVLDGVRALKPPPAADR